MFDILPNLLASLLSVLLPIFASYKALRSSDPALLSPWLMYWISFSLLTTVESHLWFVTWFIPFYAYIRIVFLLYLLLPQTQGARIIYQTRIHPFLAHHEQRIEVMIGEAHEKLRGLGLERLQDLLVFLKERVFRQQDPEPRQYSDSVPGQSYAMQLMNRFSLPSASSGLAAPAGDFYGLLSAAASTLGRNSSTPPSPSAQIEQLLRDGSLIPSHVQSPGDKARFVGQQRDKLRVLLGALEAEAGRIDGDGNKEMGRSKSEVSFERIDGEDLAYGNVPGVKKGESWMGWAFGSGKDIEPSKKDQ